MLHFCSIRLFPVSNGGSPGRDPSGRMFYDPLGHVLELSRGHAGTTTECPDKIGGIVETNLETHFRNGLITRSQQANSVIHSHLL